MRLTLRTLLAYLDNTLDPQDAELLRGKLAESGFATQLVQRIRDTLNVGSLPAPSPDAVGPVEDANVISEYLDSTLPSEQVAEIERACLESAPHLAEAAACHQILTMILGKPAEVSPELRKRIYELPDRQVEDIATAGSFSGVAIPEQTPQLRPISDELPTADATIQRDGEPVRPVGVSDSGVSDAPTRLREAEASSGQKGTAAGPAIAGAKQRSADDSKIYAGSIRPSRIAPWIVSLALAGVLLFALTRIFQPLLEPETASIDNNDSLSVPSAMDPGMDPDIDPGMEPEIEVSAEDAPPMLEVSPETDETLPQPETLPAPDSSDSGTTPGVTIEPAELIPPTPSTNENEPVSASDSGEPLPAGGAAPTPPPPETTDILADAGPVPAPETVPEPATDGAPTTVDEGPVPPPMTDIASDAPVPPPADAPPADAPPVDAPAEPETGVATVTSARTLMAGLVEDQWVRLKQDMIVDPDLPIVCGPTFRGQMESDNLIVTLVGPTEVQWMMSEDEAVSLQVKSGRILVSATMPDTTADIQIGGQTLQLRFADIDSVAGVSLQRSRRPGLDPRDPETRSSELGVLSVQGSVGLSAGNQNLTLDTGQQWIKRDANDAEISPVEAVPDWIDAPDPTEKTLESTARSGLLELIEDEESLEIGLREATLFRRSEVAALAGQTLLGLGRANVYFGGDGILSEPKQRAYWPDHYRALLASVDGSVQMAESIRESIVSMDSANAAALFRLLTGYSQKQLVEGGDEELVELLDSPSMAVRVLALENLHKITGTTLYFRAEQENAVRRAPVIKKWVVRQRKGDIRWQE